MNYLQHAYQTHTILYHSNLASNKRKKMTIYRYLSGIFLNNSIIALLIIAYLYLNVAIKINNLRLFYTSGRRLCY